MWRFAAFALLLCMGCSNSRTAWPDSGIFFDNSRTFFQRDRNDLLPSSPDGKHP